MNNRWLLTALVYVCCFSLMANVVLYVQVQEERDRRALVGQRVDELTTEVLKVRAEFNERDQAYRKARLELDACYAQLPKPKVVKHLPKRPVPAFERGGRRSD